MKSITLKAARTNAGYTQEQLAEAVGVHRQTIQKWEETPSVMSIRNAEKVCKILKVKMSDIFFGNTLQNGEK